MIYFLDNSLQLQKIVTRKNVVSAIHEQELNGLIRADVELDLAYANKFLFLGIDHVGYYYKDEFYLHKIQRLEYDHVNETVTVVLRHIFFEDMIFGKLIQDVRPQEQDALTVSRQTIDANTRWQTVMSDLTGRLSTNFYWQVPYEVIEFMIENYRIEYLPKILFDGEKINGFQLHLANKIGEDKNIRIPYGSRVLELKYEEDYSEIITKLVVHGKGEEVGDGYGRRIDISNVNFSRNGVKSPVGSLYLEDESITNTYGNDDQTPREGREVFEDIEDENELVEAGYQHYLQVSRPQVLYTADVADIGDVGIGDSVIIVRREYDVYFNARIHKLSVDLLYPEDAQVELGDYQHFKESKVERKARERDKQFKRETSDHIQRLKEAFDDRFDGETNQMWEEYEQALIDVHAQIEADRENMTNLIEGTRTEFTDNLHTEISQAKDFAEQQAQAKAESVQSNLDSFKDSHQQLYDEVTGNILDIDMSLGTLQTDLDGVESDLTTTKTDLQNQLDDARESFDELEIGGRNLLPAFTSNRWTHQARTEIEDYSLYIPSGFAGNSILFLDVEPNTNYTMTFNSDYARYYIYEVLEDESLGKIIRSTTGSETYTFNTEDVSRIRVSLNTFSGNVQEEKNIWNLKLEKGTIATDWTPAPEDADNKITNINQTITNIEGELSTKVEQTEVDTLKGTVTSQGTLLTQTVGELSSKADKSVVDTLTGRVTNTESSITQNSEEIAKKLTKSVYDENKKDTDAKITQWSNTASETAEGLERVIGRVSQTENGIETAQTRIEAEAGRIDGVLSRTSEVEGQIQDARLSIEANADGLALRVTKTEVEQAIDGIEVGTRNLIPDSHFYSEAHNSWSNIYGTQVVEEHILKKTYTRESSAARIERTFWGLEVGQTYTLTIYMKTDVDIEWAGFVAAKLIKSSDTTATEEYKVYSVTFEVTSDETVFIRGYQRSVKIGSYAHMDWFTLVKGTVPTTDWTPAPEEIDAKITKISSDLAVEAGRIEGLVTDISKDYVKQSSVKVTSDRVTIGSTVVNGSTIGSILSVSPSGIDVVADAMRLSGDLLVAGDVTALAVTAIEGNFSRLFTSSLTTNVIKSNHIQTDTALAKKLFATNANINELITRTHFSDSIKALSIDAIHADIRSVNSEIMTTNILKSEWINVDNAIVNRIISRQFFTDNAVIKAANIRDLTATDIKGGVLSSLNNSMKFDLMTNHLEFNNDATIDFYSTNNAFRMFTDSSTSDSRDIIHALGTGTSRSGYGQMFLGGGHYDIDGTVKANDIGFAGLKLAGNSASVAGAKVLIGSGGNDSQDQFFEFDFTTSLSNRYAYFKPSNSNDNFVIGTNTERFHSMFTWRLNGLRFYNPSGNVKMGYDNGSGDGASWRFFEDDIWFDRAGTWSMKQIISRTNDSYNRINADNGILKQLQNLAYRVSVLEK